MEHYFTNNESLKSDFRSVKYVYKDTPFVFTSDLGVFSKDKIDSINLAEQLSGALFRSHKNKLYDGLAEAF